MKRGANYQSASRPPIGRAAGAEALAAKHRPPRLRLERHAIGFPALIANDLKPLAFRSSSGWVVVGHESLKLNARSTARILLRYADRSIVGARFRLQAHFAGDLTNAGNTTANSTDDSPSSPRRRRRRTFITRFVGGSGTGGDVVAGVRCLRFDDGDDDVAHDPHRS